MRRLEPSGLSWKGRPQQGGPRAPLRTLTECAEMLGIGRGALGVALASDPAAPLCKMDNSRVSTASRSRWYDPVEIRRWWKQRAESAPKNVQYAGAREASGVENRTKVPENTGFHPVDVANQTEAGAPC